MAIILIAGAAAAFVFLWYLPSKSGDAVDSGLTARNLVRQAMNAMERAHVDAQSYDPRTMTPDALKAVEPTITFHPVADDGAAKTPTAMAVDRAVNYAGTATTYAVGTVDEAGTAYGAVVDKDADTKTYYIAGAQVPDWSDDTGSTTTTQPTQSTQGTQSPAGPISSADDLAAQTLIRNGMTAIDSAYTSLATFDPAVMTPAVLAQMEPSITFTAVRDTTAATAPVSLALSNAVDFYGTGTTYALGTRSESGNTFGVMASETTTGRTTTYYVNGGVRDWSSEATSATGSTISTAMTSATPPPIVARHQEIALGCSFEYPASWVEYPPESLNEAGDAFTFDYAVTDPLGGKIGSVPADYIMFTGQTEQTQPAASPSSKLESLAASLAHTSLAGGEVIEPTNAFEVNGVSAAAKTYGVETKGTATIWRLVCLASGGRFFYFFFVSEASRWNADKSIFDATLNSFQASAIG
jgi:hypothetical protein